MRLTKRVHDYLYQQLKPGDHAIDATAGNGYDTVYMAQRVGPSGHVIAIDIQPTAIHNTEQRLNAQECLQQTELQIGDHAEILHSLYPHYAHTISAITFNLGYLPGSDKRVQTTPQTTLRALGASQKLFKPEGYLLVTA